MEKEKHLKPHMYYSDLYDKATVEECRRIENLESNPSRKKYYDKEGKEVDVTPMDKLVTELMIYFLTGDRYLNKAEIVRKLMEKDEERDRFFEQAIPPENITCFTCGRIMFVSSESEELGYDDKPNRVLYFYDCPLGHLPKRVFYNNREEYRSKEHICIKCKSSTEEKHVRGKNKITSTWTCTRCGEVETYELDLTIRKPKREVVDENFEKDRNRFCLTSEEGSKYASWKASSEQLSKMFEKDKEKESKKEVYDEVAKIKKLKILELEELLVPVLEKAKYTKFHMKDPEVGKDVFVPFVVYDSDPNRNDRTSTFDLEKLFRKILKDTNWRLMTGGANYRLGMLEGRLRAYEREEDLVKLVEQKNKS